MKPVVGSARRLLSVAAAGAAFAAAFALPSIASAATIGGVITDNGGTPLDGMEVRLWADTNGKGFVIIDTTLTRAGAYQLEADIGQYRIDARMPNGMDGNYADRWFDVAEPFSDGWVAASADLITITEDIAIAGVDISLPTYGGLDGTVTPLVGGYLVRIERAMDYRIHHNDYTDADPHLGAYSMRGLPPAADYRMFVVDPSGAHEVLYAPGPYTVTASVNSAPAGLTLATMPADPYEPNNTSTAGGATSVDPAGFRLPDPTPWSTAGAWIGPRNGDIDYYCFDARIGERFIAYTETSVPLPAGGVDERTREAPWTDLMLRFVSEDGVVLAENDDRVPGTFNAFVDSGAIVSPGNYCVVVTTYGDTAFTGSTQGSAGRYDLIIEVGNAPPDISVTYLGSPIPPPPGTIIVTESATAVFDISASDPDGDPVFVDVQNTDANGTPVTGVVDVVDGVGTYTWEVSATAGATTPYDLVFTATDGEASVSTNARVAVSAVNSAPPTPTHLIPDDASVLTSTDVLCVILNSNDPDGDVVTYEFEVYANSTSGLPVQSATVNEDPAGQSLWTPTDLLQDTPYLWRVRANDGNALNGYSAWTEPWTFVISTENDAPATPELLKPFANEIYTDTFPALQSSNVDDPEGDDVSYVFEISADSAFTDIVVISDPVAESEMDERTTWTSTEELQRGSTYYARVAAIDPAGNRSEYSNVNNFSIAANGGPASPTLGGRFGSQCTDLVFSQGIPRVITVNYAADAQSDDVTIELQIFNYDDDPETDLPLIDESVPQSGNETLINIDDSLLTEDGHYRIRVRANDGTDASVWFECDFWIDIQQSGTPEAVIVYPEDGSSVPVADTVNVQIQNIDDPAFGRQGHDTQFAFCLGIDGSDDCTSDPNNWPRLPQSSADPSEVTLLPINGLSVGLEVFVSVCAINEANECGPGDSTTFTIDRVTSGTGTGCNCQSTTPAGRQSWAWAALATALIVTRRRRNSLAS